MDQIRAYGSGLTDHCALVAERDLDNYAKNFSSGSFFWAEQGRRIILWHK